MISYSINLAAGWGGLLAGALSGILIGLRFHRPGWLGGYDGFRRRMVRLGHIAFFGLGFVNILFAVSAGSRSPAGNLASAFFLVGLATMSLNCFLTAWRESFRRLFFIPSLSVAVGVAAALVHLA